MTIYLDILIAVNLLFTYLFLVLTRLIQSIPTNKYLISLASLVGGFSSLVIFLDDLPLVLSVLFKIFVASAITLIAFTPKNIRLFLKELFCFLTVTFIFGGIMFFLELTNFKKNLLYINGTVYFNISLTYLLISVLAIYFIYLILNYFFTVRNLKNEIFTVTVFYNNSSVTVGGFLDTGNMAVEPFTNAPVFIGELNSFAPLFNLEELRFFKSDLKAPPQDLSVRLIPIKTPSGDALLKGFKPQKIIVKNKKESAEIKNSYIALESSSLSDGEYKIILNKSILDLRWSKNEKLN